MFFYIEFDKGSRLKESENFTKFGCTYHATSINNDSPCPVNVDDTPLNEAIHKNVLDPANLHN